jgi:hypothetical protein
MTMTDQPRDAAVEAARNLVHAWTSRKGYEIELLIETIAAHTEAAVKGKKAELEKVWGYVKDHARVIDDLTARLAATEAAEQAMANAAHWLTLERERLTLANEDLTAAVNGKAPACGTCGGIPPLSGLPCVCGGKNTLYAEAQGLRDELFDLTARLAAVEGERDMAIAAFKEKVQDFADEIARHRETGARLAAAEGKVAIQHTCTHCGYIEVTQYGEDLTARLAVAEGALLLYQASDHLVIKASESAADIANRFLPRGPTNALLTEAIARVIRERDTLKAAVEQARQQVLDEIEQWSKGLVFGIGVSEHTERDVRSLFHALRAALTSAPGTTKS